jgi:wyosine [tRNA(Phe)-imidazoG37] synthetase (radical SAM superfamily)
MNTFLFDNIIFGPIKSRRLGHSLGINLISNTCKQCTFNCVYCECGWTKKQPEEADLFPKKTQVLTGLEFRLNKIKAHQLPLDAITFAGNGEPTLHPDFAGIVDGTVEIRNNLFPAIPVAVLSNATMVQNKTVFNALQKIDQNILKLDGGNESIIRKINQPLWSFDLKEIVEHLKKFRGNLIVQTLFVKGTIYQTNFDNTTEKEIADWLTLLKKINPRQVMLYSLDRNTPSRDLEKIPVEQLRKIAQKVEKLGISTMVS